MSNTITVNLPDIGDFDAVEVIEVLVEAGQTIAVDDSIITLESDKASMEIPSPYAGKVASLSVVVGDKMKQGDEILQIFAQQTGTQKLPQTQQKITPSPEAPQKVQVAGQDLSTAAKEAGIVGVVPAEDFHASPAIRKLARELGVDLAIVPGSGKRGRITEADIKSFVKQALKNSTHSSEVGGIPSIADVDFAKFGTIKTQDLSRINKISGQHLHACWLNIPHVCQFEEADISDLERFRQAQKAKGVKYTPLIFIIKAVARALKTYPRFNSSLSTDKQSLIMKHYINIGIAVDTPDGLMVPVIRDADKKSLSELSAELIVLSARAREGKLSSSDLAGGSFSISSLGSIGGTQFTPIVNAPEVAILGVSRARMTPLWNGKEFVPKLMLPLALSYDHRVIDGAQGVRFITELSGLLSDIRRLL